MIVYVHDITFNNQALVNEIYISHSLLSLQSVMISLKNVNYQGYSHPLCDTVTHI
jgi:hypothetical protein